MRTPAVSAGCCSGQSRSVAVLTSTATSTEKLKHGFQARAHTEPIYETNYFVDDCAYHIRMCKPQRARRKSVQLYPGLPQREVVSLFGMPNKAEGNPDEGNSSGDYLVWEYDDIDLKITFRHTQAGWVVKTWSID